jgi:pimeloyl-ACP methyl ester carboxylesterase
MTASAYVMLQGERVYYETGGAETGKALVFVHGIGAGNSSHLYRRNTEVLAKGYRIYAFDFPGFGRSGARAMRYTNDLYTGVLKDFLREVVREPAAIVAGSLGSDYAIRAAVEEPALITRLLLANPSGYGEVNGPPDPGRYDLFAKSFVGDVTFSLLRTDLGLNFFLWYSVYLDRSLVTPEVTALYSGNLQGPDKQYAPFSFFAGFLSQPVRDLWPRTTQPTLLVWGSDDVFTPLERGKAMVADRAVELVVLPARAIPYDERATEFNEIALRFLN